MNRRVAVIVIASCLLLAATVLSGCAGSSSGGASGTQGSASKTVELSAADNGKTVEAEVGSTIVVELEANPTTGYTWSVDGALPPILKSAGEPSFKPSSTAVGSPSTMTMKFAATQAGDGDLKLKYWRTFEATVPPVATFQVTLKVK